MADARIPLTMSSWDGMAKHSGGYDEDRDCFVAVEEVPVVPYDFDGKYTTRKGSVVVRGPVRPRDALWCVSPRLAELIGMEVPRG